jgi:hypothetical protein
VRPRLPLAAALTAALLSAGCMQLETRIKVEEDGTATVTERLRFSRRVLDLAGGKRGELMALLGKESALRRMARMGKGITLSSHQLREAEGASQESLAVFKVKDLNGFKYVTPWAAYLDFPENNTVSFKMKPYYKSCPYARPKAGTLGISWHYAKRPKGEPKPPKDAKPPKGPSPLELQVHRELGPVFRDMLKDFQLRLTIESYAPVNSGLGVRGRRAGAREVDLLNFSDAALDKWGGLFLENEEIMLDLVRWQLGGNDVVEHVRGYHANLTLPVFFPAGSKHMWWSGGTDVWFAPSRQLFDRHFAGKKLDLSAWQASPPSKHVPANFEKIGWKGLRKGEKPGNGGGK